MSNKVLIPSAPNLSAYLIENEPNLRFTTEDHSSPEKHEVLIFLYAGDQFYGEYLERNILPLGYLGSGYKYSGTVVRTIKYAGRAPGKKHVVLEFEPKVEYDPIDNKEPVIGEPVRTDNYSEIPFP